MNIITDAIFRWIILIPTYLFIGAFGLLIIFAVISNIIKVIQKSINKRKCNKLGHDWINCICNRCAETRDEGHSYINKSESAHAREYVGYETTSWKECIYCGKKIDEETTPDQ